MFPGRAPISTVSDSCDILIVGGGPAGSSCAWRLRQAGLNVLIIDKSEFPRDKVCAGWITPEVLQLLQLQAEEYAQENLLQPIDALCTGIIGGTPLETRYDKPVSYGIRRSQFDHYLLQRSGAARRLGYAVREIRREGDGWLINGEIRARLLIGAGGHFCPVARLLNRGEENPEVVVAKEVEFSLSREQADACAISGSMPELYFCPDLQGYGWCFRKGDFLNIGLGRRQKGGLSAELEQFVAWLQQSGRIGFEPPPAFRGHAYHTYDQRARRRLAEGLLLIGDAAGLAFSESGEGILPAVQSGLMAAEAVVACRGSYGQADLLRYEQSLTRRFGDATAFQPLDLLPASLKRLIGRGIMASPHLTRRVVVEGWFLHAEPC